MKFKYRFFVFFISVFFVSACWADGSIRGYVDEIKFYTSGVVNISFLEAEDAGGSGLTEFNGHCNNLIMFVHQSDMESEMYYSVLFSAKAIGKKVEVTWSTQPPNLCELEYTGI